MISSARPRSRRNTRPDALANKTSSVSPHAHGGRMTLFPWINPITREAPYSRESRSSCKHTCAVTAQTPKFRRRITGGTPGNVVTAQVAGGSHNPEICDQAVRVGCQGMQYMPALLPGRRKQRADHGKIHRPVHGAE